MNFASTIHSVLDFGLQLADTTRIKYNNHKTKIVLLAWVEMKGIAFLRVYKDVRILISYGIFFFNL